MTHEIRKVACTWGRLTAAVAIVILAMPSVSPAQGVVSVGDGQTFEVRYTATFSKDALLFGELMGFDTVSIEDGGCLNEPGKPMLPTQTVGIALPPGMAVTGVRVVGTQATELAGKYTVFPAQPPRPVSDPATKDDFVAPDPQTYASPQAYPAELVTFTHQADLAGQGIAFLQVCPVQYVPTEKKLTLLTSIDVVLEGVGGYICGDYLPAGVSESRRDVYEQMVAGMVVNPDDVELQVSSSPPPQTLGVEPGDYDYVIVTQSSWESNFQTLADWKTKKGVPATVVTTSWIYNEGGYSGNNQQKIRAFVQDAHNNWGTMFFLLGGDTNVVPYHSKYLLGEYVPNDTNYADYDSDWVCEVHVGRAAVRTTGAVNIFIEKIFTYEKNPPLTNYAKTAAFFGFDLHTYGSGEGENAKKAIKNLYLPSGWTYRYEYDSEGGNHKTEVIGYLNQGNNLVNHADHSYTDSMGVGYTNHGWMLYKSDMSGLGNGDRQSILYTMGCYACDYPATTCIGEAFVQNWVGGGVALIGNSRYGWYYAGYSDQLSLRYDRYFFRSLFQQGHTTLGDCFSDHKHDSYQYDQYYQYIYTELTLLGDPELPIWTEDPQSLTVTHDATLNVGQYTTFPVQVSSGGNPLQSATVCLWKVGDVYEVAQTDSSGTATFGFTPETTGTMYVTASKHNYLPYEGEAEVVEMSVLVGDVNCDGEVDFNDINPFVLALSDPDAYEAMYPNCPFENRDINGDGEFDFNDINPFVVLLSGTGG